MEKGNSTAPDDVIAFCSDDVDRDPRATGETLSAGVGEVVAGLLDRVRQSNEELSDFAHVVSHDLREPLRKLACFGSILAESLHGSLSGEDAESLDIMIDGADRMQKMIATLLAYTRVTSPPVKLEAVDLHRIVQPLRDFELAVLLEEEQVVLDVSEPLPTVQGDPVQICELL